jgi:hypothetical protein
MKFSTGRVNAFYMADHQERESIRRDLLEERYTDLQMEMENIENLLNISEQERDEILFEINDFLFECLEELVPELVEEETQIIEGPGNDAEVVKQARMSKIKDSEKAAINIAKNAEKIKGAKSTIRTAHLQLKGSGDPKSKLKAREGLRSAQANLAATSMKAKAVKK